MSLPRPFRSLPMALGLALMLALPGCTLTPVHGDPGGAPTVALRYATPMTRLEQVFYRALSARLPASTSPAAAQLSARVSVSSARIGLSRVSSPVTDYQIVARATYTLTDAEGQTTSGVRTATAGYQTTGQMVADGSARTAAEERAVQAVAEAVRLALIAQGVR